MARVVADPHHIIVSGQNLSSAAVGKPAHFSMSNVAASLDEIEVNVEGEKSSRYKISALFVLGF
jgi:filamin